MRKDTYDESQNMNSGERTDDAVSTLMNLAGPRVEIPAEIEKRVLENVRQHWQKSTSRRKTYQWAIPASLAATILIVFAINFQAPDVQLRRAGTITYVPGDRMPADSTFVVGDTVYIGEHLETGADSGVTLSFADDISLRIAANTSIRFDQVDEITLLRGRVYADSGDRIYRDRHLAINTPAGSARDIGTQFSVAYEGTRMSVAVREGRVDVARDQSNFTAKAGERLVLEPDTDAVIDQIAPFDPFWNWATSLAPDFDIESRSLLDFLKWAARETGRTLVFSGDDVRMATMGTQLSGSIKRFTPEEALKSVLATTRFDYKIDERNITIDD